MRKASESRENLVSSDSSNSVNAEDGKDEPYDSLNETGEYVLTQIEKKFLLSAERGDCAGVRRYWIHWMILDLEIN